MRRLIALSIASLSCLHLSSQPASAADSVQQWPQWRGPLATGEAPHADPPTSWSETNNVRWKTRIPGSGESSPVVWENQVFVTSAVKVENPPAEKAAYDFVLLSLDKQTGAIQWTRKATNAVPHEGHHPDHGYASGSPTTDGEVVLAYFGSRGLHCYDLKGEIKWSREFGQMKTRNAFGEGASPALFKDIVIVNWDDETTNDFIVALDRRTGKELWKAPRDEDTDWSTPLIVTHEGRQQVVVNAAKRVRSYDLTSGKQIWECGGQTANPIPSPVASKDTVYVTSGFRGNAAVAIALGRTGDLTGTDAIRWSRNKNTPYVPSPLLVGGLLYLVTGNNPVITCLDAATGEPHYEAVKLEGPNSIYASPVAAGGRVYIFGRNGVCAVLKQGKTLEVLSTNRLAEKTDATPALVGKQMFVRGKESLYCIAE